MAEVISHENVYFLPLEVRSPLLHEWSVEASIRIENFDRVSQAYGLAEARKVHSAILSRVHRALGSCGAVTPEGNGGLELLIWDPAAIGGDPAPAKAAAWLAGLARRLILEPVLTGAGPVHANISVATRKGFGSAFSFESGSAGIFNGAGVHEDEDRTYRSDMAAVSPLLRALGEPLQGRSAGRDAEADVLWRPIATVPKELAGQAPGRPMFEASLGLVNSSGQVLAVDALIGSAERLGVVHLVDQHLVSRVVAELFHPANALALSVGVSAASLHPGEFWNDIYAMLEGRPAVAKRLILEVRDSSDHHDWSRAAEVISSLRRIGVKLSIGNFGTGFASLRHLVALRPDFITVDRRLMAAVGLHDVGEGAFYHLAALARSLGAEVVIDGVDDEDASVRAESLGATFQKGSWLGMPRLCRPWATGCSH